MFVFVLFIFKTFKNLSNVVNSVPHIYLLDAEFDSVGIGSRRQNSWFIKVISSQSIILFITKLFL